VGGKDTGSAGGPPASKDTGSVGGPPAPIASTTAANTLTRLPRGQAGEPPALPVVPDLLRANEKSATDVSPGTAAIPAAMFVGARFAGSGRASRDGVPQGLRRSRWVTGVRGGQFTDPAPSPAVRGQ